MDEDLRKKSLSVMLKVVGALTLGLISFFGMKIILLLALDKTKLLFGVSVQLYFPLILAGFYLLSKKYQVNSLIYRGILINFFLFIPSAFLVLLMAESSDKEGVKIFMSVALTSLLLLVSLSISGLFVLFGRENKDKLNLSSKWQTIIFAVLFGCSLVVSLLFVMPLTIY